MNENTIYGVDPGPVDTGWVLWDGKAVVGCGISPNQEFLERLRSSTEPTPLYIEMIASYGMAVGKETFETVLWIGRFVEVWSIMGYPFQLCYRKRIATHHCMDGTAGDSNINTALRDKYGQKGTKKNPGPLFGIKDHMWSALAVATYALESKLACSSTIG